jgi:hypothetical protein
LLADDHGPGALLAGDVEVAGDPFELLLEDQRTDVSVGVDAVADLRLLPKSATRPTRGRNDSGAAMVIPTEAEELVTATARGFA